VAPAAAAIHRQLSRPGADGRGPAPRAAATPRIIVADDDISIRTIVRRVLTAELRAEVIEVTDGLGVLEALQTSEFDLAILDIEMNVLDGLDTLEAIRTASFFRNLPVIVISGRVDEATLSRIKSWHVQGLLAKPLTMTVISERLLPLVRRILEAQPAATATPPVSRLALRPSSRVFVVGSDDEYSRVLHAELHGCCALTLHRDESAALRAALTRPPDMIFLAPSDPLVSPTIFARAMRRGLKAAPRIILCKRAEAHRHEDDATFPRLEAATPDALLRTLRAHLTESGVSLAVLNGSAAAATLCEWSRDRIATSLGHAVQVGQPPRRWSDTDDLAIEASVSIVVDGLRWRTTVMVTRAFAILHAAMLRGCDTDLVSPDAAVQATSTLATEVATYLSGLWREHQVVAQIGSPDARSTPLVGQTVMPDERGAVVWWLSASINDPAVATFSIVPAADGTSETRRPLSSTVQRSRNVMPPQDAWPHSD
jgi:CheY-like chemotaxis protein